MKFPPLLPLVLACTSLSFSQINAEPAGAETEPLMMFGVDRGKGPIEGAGRQGACDNNKPIRREEETEKIVDQEQWSLPTKEELDLKIEQYRSEQLYAQRNAGREKVRNFNSAAIATEYARVCLSKRDKEISVSEKTAWDEIIYYSLKEAQAHAEGERERALAYHHGILALGNVVRCLHYVTQAPTLREQEVLQREATYHHQNALQNINEESVDNEQFNETILSMRKALVHFQNASKTESTQKQQAEIMLGELSIQEAEMRQQNKEQELQNSRAAILAAEQAIQYCDRVHEMEHPLAKMALERAAEYSLLRSQAFAANQIEKASHFLWAADSAGDAACHFHQVAAEATKEKQAKYTAKGEYHLELAKLWKQHEVERASKFSYQQFQARKQKLLLPPVKIPGNLSLSTLTRGSNFFSSAEQASFPQDELGLKPNNL